MREPWLADHAAEMDRYHTIESRKVRFWMCQRKCRFYTEPEARRAAKKARLRQADDGPPIHAYPCPHGRHWHIGHQSAKYSS